MSNIINKISYFSLFIGYLLTMQVNAMTDFFPSINGNLTKVTWAHAVNNKTLLQEALNSSVMMLEADVVLGKVTGTDTVVPIMCHPPGNTSDLSLENFLKSVNKFNTNSTSSKKGIKLDFKEIDAFTKSVEPIRNFYNYSTSPLWINADIINGPNSNKTPVNSDKFLSQAKTFPTSVLSLGWTTGSPGKNVSYSDVQINDMINTIQKNNDSVPITFAVRAGIAANSFDQMKSLKEKVNNCTLTIWSSEGDEVDVDKLRNLIFDYGVNRVYIDVPKDLYERLNLGNSAKGIRASVAMFSILIIGIMLLF